MSCEIYEIWDELCSDLFAIAPAYQTLLAKPASDTAIEAVQTRLNVLVPDSYREFLRIHDGTQSRVFVAFELFDILNVRKATHARRLEELGALWDRTFLEGGWDETKLVIGDSQIGWKMVLDCETEAIFVHEQSNYSLKLADSFVAYLIGLRENLRHGHYQLINGKVFMGDWGAKCRW